METSKRLKLKILFWSLFI